MRPVTQRPDSDGRSPGCLPRLLNLTTPGARLTCNPRSRVSVPGGRLARAARCLLPKGVPFDGTPSPAPRDARRGGGTGVPWVRRTWYILWPRGASPPRPPSLPRQAPRPPPTSCAHPTASFLVLLHVVFDSPYCNVWRGHLRQRRRIL